MIIVLDCLRIHIIRYLTPQLEVKINRHKITLKTMHSHSMSIPYDDVIIPYHSTQPSNRAFTEQVSKIIITTMSQHGVDS